MRALRLLSTAAQAEGLLLRRQGARMGRAAVFGAMAAGFGLAMLALLHLAGWLWLEERHGALPASLFVALADGVLAVILLLLARGGRDPVAEEARALRQQSVALLTAPSAIRPEWERLALSVGGYLLERALRQRR
ncbi:hypothetical protein [Sediminicoccus rosea]|jgi:hypothetical protein|uniref:Holin-X, holin superfamily III n=1 Tax=Sediminicoccus rosea TaxID=1225128 RepID=A0ABZ0PLG2_9PROT|nr:hypothetical protein [Sediminicoccus rosea]WPB86202.1 hypothetical protein R9Z33_04865 [Sediminicoccus rosea]